MKSVAQAYFGTRLSPHMSQTPEGYLICHDVPINRTGSQTYLAHELELSGDPNRPVTVSRHGEDVFHPAALASFEGKDVTWLHPDAFLTPENQARYSKGHVSNVRRVGEATVADLVIKDPALMEEIRSGRLRQVSCGYHCVYQPEGDGFRQTHIRGNHVAIVPKGRAGAAVAIQDAAPVAEKGRNPMTDIWKNIFTAFGRLAREADPQELEEFAQSAADVLEQLPQPEEEPSRLIQEDKPGLDPQAKEAVLALLRQVRPAVASIQDRDDRNRVARAILDALGGEETLEPMLQAARDSAAQRAAAAQDTPYDLACREAQQAYNSRNPHMKEV